MYTQVSVSDDIPELQYIISKHGCSIMQEWLYTLGNVIAATIFPGNKNFPDKRHE